MKRIMIVFYGVSSLLFFVISCTNKTKNKEEKTVGDSSLVNTNHLDHLYIPITFTNQVKSAGIYIYSEAPDYRLVDDSDEGFTCIDDVARAILVYKRNKNFSTDTVSQNKVFSLLQFILEMQSDNGYFYNFLFRDNTINRTGETSKNTPGWWSWRALQTLTELHPEIKKTDAVFAKKIEIAISKIIVNIKSDLAQLPLSKKNVTGIEVPQWLPAGSATDQAAIIILALIDYSAMLEDPEINKFIRKLADGIVMMQHGNEKEFPHSAFLSWENVWHAYGCDQAYALLKAGTFLNDSSYVQKALKEVDNFYPWLLKNGMKASFSVKKGNEIIPFDEQKFSQIAYGIRPMIFAATEAFDLTGQQKYADMAGHLASWFFGTNVANEIMYDKNTGRCYDGIISEHKLNTNSGAESTIECLLALQRIERYPAIISALNKYKKQ